MTLLDRMAVDGHEQVIFHHDPDSGLRAIVALHSTVLGPALGGTRWFPYATEEAALTDVLRLSGAMTQKAAMAGLKLGGGKAAVIGDPAQKTPAHLHAYGRFIESLGGRYITTTDVGTTTAEMDLIRDDTRWVMGTSPERGGSGDTSVLTAATVVQGLRAALSVAYGDDRFAARRIVVVGTGKVGSRVARATATEGAQVVVADVRTAIAEALAQEIGAEWCPVEEAYRRECDVFSPNALGNVITAETIPMLHCRIVCGGANNQLGRDPEDADLLAARGILYVPDYVVNSGGVINVAVEIEGYDPDRARRLANGVYDTTRTVLESAQQLGISTAAAAARQVQERLATAKAARRR